jgi:hypothetical protein
MAERIGQKRELREAAHGKDASQNKFSAGMW